MKITLKDDIVKSEVRGGYRINLEEANMRLKKRIDEDQLKALTSLYLLLDLDKDDFCKIVDTIGTEKLLNKRKHYDRLDRAERDLAAKERYLKAKARLAELETEKEELNTIVDNYKPL